MEKLDDSLETLSAMQLTANMEGLDYVHIPCNQRFR